MRIAVKLGDYEQPFPVGQMHQGNEIKLTINSSPQWGKAKHDKVQKKFEKFSNSKKESTL